MSKKNNSNADKQTDFDWCLAKMLATAEPGTIFMAGGFPNPEMFPFQSMEVQVDDNTRIELDEASIRPALQYQPTLG